MPEPGTWTWSRLSRGSSGRSARGLSITRCPRRIFDLPLRAEHTGRVGEYDAYITAYRHRWAAEAESAAERAAWLRRVASELAGLCRSYGATRVILFGSAARGATRSEGDLDIAVAGVPPERFFTLYGSLLTVSPVSVDLVDLDDCPEALRESVEREGVALS